MKNITVIYKSPKDKQVIFDSLVKEDENLTKELFLFASSLNRMFGKRIPRQGILVNEREYQY